jgi:hypothetical protein
MCFAELRHEIGTAGWEHVNGWERGKEKENGNKVHISSQ